MSAHSLTLRERSIFGVPARALGLFLRSRQAWQAPVGFVLAAVLATAFVRRYDDQWLAQATALTLAPLLAACLIGAGAGSPFGEPERTAALPLPALRVSHLTGLVLLAAACLLAANGLFVWFEAPVEAPERWLATSAAEVSWTLVRNVLAFAGLALIGSRLLGAGLAWVAPLGVGLLSLVVLMLAMPVDGEPLVRPLWAVPVQPAGHGGALMAAGALLIVGLVAVALSGANDARGDEVV